MLYKKSVERKAELLTAALVCARRYGWMQMTRSQVATQAGVTDGLISHYWGTMNQLRRSVMREALRVGDTVILAQGIALKDSTALKAPAIVRKQIATAWA